MRSIVLISVTLFVLLLGFGVYWWFQPASTPQTRSSIHTTPSATTSPSELRANPGSKGIIGKGKRPYLKVIDPKTGALTSQFRAEEYNPQSDDTVSVVQPEAMFYLARGQVIRVLGKTGTVNVPPSAGDSTKDDLRNSGLSQPPTRGELHDVTIWLYDSAEKAEAATNPSLTVELNNIAFDNETFRLYTERYIGPDGKPVEADQVPVKVRGADYEFDGRGLIVRWNELDQRLQFMEIAHGQKLIVKNPHHLRSPDQRAEKPAPASTAAPVAVTTPTSPDPAAPLTRRRARRQAIAAPAPVPTPPPDTSPSDSHTARDEPPPLYRATFAGDVRITQADQTLALADRMSVDFLLPESSADSQSDADKPSDQPQQLPPPATAPAPTAPPQPATRQTISSPASDDRDQPVAIYWSGKLTIAPSEPDALRPSDPGEQVVQMFGSPLVLRWMGAEPQAHRRAWEASCASLVYLNAASDRATAAQHTWNLLLQGSSQYPLQMSDAQGVSITTMSAQFSQADGIAILHGRSKALIPEHSDPDTAPRVLKVDWSSICTLHFASAQTRSLDHGSPTIERAELAGDVHVEHAQLDLKAATLDLTMDSSPAKSSDSEPTTKPADGTTPIALKSLVAAGNVSCSLAGTDADAHVRTIECDRLTMETALGEKGTRYPRQLSADGQVHAFDAKDQRDATQDLRAGHLVVTLEPTTRPANAPDASPVLSAAAPVPADDAAHPASQLALKDLVAYQDVKATTPDGDLATGDQLLISMRDGKSQIKLMGQPAVVISKRRAATPADATTAPSVPPNASETRLEGPIIQAVPDDQQAAVLGPGKMHSLWKPSDSNTAPRPIDITWTTGLNADVAKDRIQIDGGVVLTTPQEDGAIATANCERLRLDLADDPTTRPTTRTSQRDSRTPDTATSVSDLSAVSGGKVVRAVTLEAASPQDKIEINSVLSAPDGSLLRRVNLFASTIRYELTRQGLTRVVIPVPGQLLVEEHRTADQLKADNKDDDSAASARGATAFQWNKDFLYDQADGKASMNGGVRIVHTPPDDEPQSSQQRFDLRTEKLIATLEQIPNSATQPQTTTRQPNLKLRVTDIQAEGDVTVNAANLEFTAPLVQYNPITHWLEARTVGGKPVEVTRGLSTGSWDQIRYNLKDDNMEATGMRGQSR